MARTSTKVDMLHLAEILYGIAEGKLGIPEFQRDFDWNDSDVRLLLNTVFSGWPAGSLLLSDARDSPYELRALGGGQNFFRTRVSLSLMGSNG